MYGIILKDNKYRFNIMVKLFQKFMELILLMMENTCWQIILMIIQ